MKQVKHAFFGIGMIAFLGLASCGTTKETPSNVDQSQEVPAKEIGAGMLYGNGAEGISEGGVVINNSAEFEVLVNKMNSTNEGYKMPSVDFEQSTVLAYFDKTRGSGGHSVQFERVIKNNGNCTAIVKTTVPLGNAIDIMTQPYVIVTIPKTEGSIEFKVDPTE